MPLTLLLFLCITGKGQELFINAMPASTLAKGVWSYRFALETFNDETVRRYWGGLRLMYGLTSNFMLIATTSISNHHLKKFPKNPWVYFSNHHNTSFNRNYPLEYDGVHLYGQYRIFKNDQQNGHLRIAAFGEASYTNAPHDEAEANLMGDNAGLGGGFIITKLVQRFAFSGKVGLIYPFTYKEKAADLTFRSGNSRYILFSSGYLLYPGKYTSYSNLNINLYLEALYKEYDEGVLTVQGKYAFINNFFYLRQGRYLELRPGIQFILNSKSRIDISVAYPVYGNTFIRIDPTLNFAFQKYLFK